VIFLNPPAEGRLVIFSRGDRIAYLEYQASDGCQKDDVVINLATFSVEKHERWRGDTVERRSTLTTRLQPREPPGDGSPTRPLVKLN